MSRSNSVIAKSLRLGRVVRLRNRPFYPLSRVRSRNSFAGPHRTQGLPAWL